MTEGKKQIIVRLLEEYDIETAEAIQDALADLLGEAIKRMVGAEMEDYLAMKKVLEVIIKILEMAINLKALGVHMESLI